jgi:cell division septation protein DedD
MIRWVVSLVKRPKEVFQEAEVSWPLLSLEARWGPEAAHCGHDGMRGLLRPMVVPKKLSLPDGYWARHVGGAWYLFDPEDVLLMGPEDGVTVEEYAWRDVWRWIDQDKEHEVAAFRAGTRPLQDLRRVRQHLRILDVVTERHPELEKQPSRAELIGWRTFAVASAAAAAAFVLGASGGSIPILNRHTAPVSAVFPKPFGSAGQDAGAPPLRAVAASDAPDTTPRAAARAHRPARPRLTAKYAVSVGTFASRATAYRMMHFVRSKGYIVDVMLSGTVSRVVTAPYRTRTQANRVAHAFEEIGLPAQLTAWRMP